MLPDARPATQTPIATAPPAPLRLGLDRAALVANWRALDRLSGLARAGAAVKANAYGTGAERVVPLLAEAGCRDFFVAHWCEADLVADLLPRGALAVLHGPLTAAEAAWGRARGVKPVLNSLAQARLWLEAGGGACDLMVDTGINRLGLALTDLSDPLLARLDIDVLHSHLASAEDETPQNAQQQARWMDARRAVAHRRASLANSAGIVLGPDYHGDLTRPGLSLYGGVPCAALVPHIRPVVRPEAMVMLTRAVSRGDRLGYNATFTAPGDMRIGLIALGYADGYLRAWSNCGSARWGDRHLPVLGRVSMDMTIIDLSAAPDVQAGDWVSIDYDLPTAAAATGLSQYELLTSLGPRFTRE